MKSMKNLGLGRMLHSKKKGNDVSAASTRTHEAADAPPLDTPEANAERAVRSFCESGGPDGQQGEEVLYLPTIVDSAESSPKAANICAYQIRKSIAHGATYQKYNAIMLTRILSDNPGETFTRNLDVKFVTAVRDLLRQGNDLNVTHILIETLDNFEQEKQHDLNLAPLLAMWKKEQGRFRNSHLQKQQAAIGRPSALNSPNYFSRGHQNKGLPAPEELSSRIQEAKTSAQILSQLTRSTPPTEISTNDLLREFANRCQSASRSIQGYMTAENPTPDNDTMLTLIETNELLQRAQSQHQRAILNARKEVVPMDDKKTMLNQTLMPQGNSFAPVSSDPFQDPSPDAQNLVWTDIDNGHASSSKAYIESSRSELSGSQSHPARHESSIGGSAMYPEVPMMKRAHESDEDLYSASSTDAGPQQVRFSNKGKQSAYS